MSLLPGPRLPITLNRLSSLSLPKHFFLSDWIESFRSGSWKVCGGKKNGSVKKEVLNQDAERKRCVKF
jgi:hypothetical protein